MNMASGDEYASQRELPQEDLLTLRQQQIVQTILESLDGRGYPPSLREIGEAVGLNSTSAVSHQLSVLVS
jgi:repressor LexA